MFTAPVAVLADEPGAVVLCDSPNDIYVDQWFYRLLDTLESVHARRVVIDSESYEVALHYMYRLERSDFDNTVAVRSIADAAGKSEQQFRERFGYLVGLGEPPA